jgi:hypothetical protein
MKRNWEITNENENENGNENGNEKGEEPKHHRPFQPPSFSALSYKYPNIR